MRRSSLLGLVLVLVGAPLGACQTTRPLPEQLAGEEPAAPGWSELFGDAAIPGLLPVAQVVAEAVMVTSPAKLPKKWTPSLPESGIAGGIGGHDGIVILVAGGDPTAVVPARVFNKIVIKPGGGKRAVGRWQNDLGGALACSSAASAKNVRVVVKGKQPQQVGSGSVVAFLAARVPLAGLGLSDAQFVQLCESAPDLIRQLLDNLAPAAVRAR